MARIAVLGTVEVHDGDRLVDVGHARQRCLFAVLVVAANRVVPAGHLVERLWGQRAPQRAYGTLRTYISRLRSALAGLDSVRLEHRADGYQLSAGEGIVDLHQFRELVRRAHSCPDPRAAELFSAALDLWRGEPFAGLDTAWLAETREALSVERLSTEIERTDVFLRLGRHDSLLPELARQVTVHPLDERIAGQLMLTLYRVGRQADALSHYESVRTQLADELGAHPRPELRRLHQQILANDPRLHAEPDSRAVRLTAAGEHPKAVPRQLPAEAAGFVGRTDELAVLDALLTGTAPAAARVAAIHGTAGIGKTSLALHWAHRVHDEFPDGQLHLDLCGYGPIAPTTPHAALGYLLSSLGTVASGIPGGTAERAALLRTLTSGRRMLLLLDNARDAGQVRALLPGPGCVVVVTSRRRLRGLRVSDGARGIALGGLSDAAALEMLTNHIGAERVRAEPAMVSELVRMCGRLPLALRLAAEYAAGFGDVPLSELVDQLSRRRAAIGTLPQDDSDTDLHAVFSWSSDALSPDAATAYSTLGLHPSGDITADATAALLQIPVAAARQLLRELFSVHLVEEPRPGRFHMHDLIRDHALDRVRAQQSAAERDGALEHLLDWYVHATAGVSSALNAGSWRNIPPPRVRDPATPIPVFETTADAHRWCEAERVTLVAAARVAADRQLDRHVCELTRRLHVFLARREYYDDLGSLAQLALASAFRLDDPDAISATALILGWMRSDQFLTAEPLLRTALHHASSVPDPSRTYAALNALAVVHYKAGHASQAVDMHEQAVRQAQTAGSPGMLGQALTNYAYTLLQLGHYTHAIDTASRGLSLYHDAGNQYENAFALRILANAHHRLDEPTPALDYCTRALKLARAVDDPTSLIDMLTLRGRVHASTNEPQRAHAYWNEALTLLRPDQRAAVEEIERLLAELPQPSTASFRDQPTKPTTGMPVVP